MLQELLNHINGDRKRRARKAFSQVRDHADTKEVERANIYKLKYAILRRHARNLNNSNNRFTSMEIVNMVESKTFKELISLHKELFDSEYTNMINEEIHA